MNKTPTNLSSISREWRMAQKEAYSVKPTDVYTQNNIRTAYYKDYLYRLIRGMFDVTIPDKWYYEYVMDKLILQGGLMVTRYKGATIPCGCRPIQYSIFYAPARMASDNGDIPITRTVGDDCELIYLECVPFVGFKGLTYLIDLYAEKLSSIDAGFDINVFNTRAPWLMEAQDAKDADNLKKLYQKISNGDPAIFWHNKRRSIDGQLPIYTLPIRENYIADKLIEAKRAVIGEFREAVGINSVDYEKKERLVTAEANANNQSTECSSELWRYNLKRCCDKVNVMYDIGISINVREEIFDDDYADYDGIRHIDDISDTEI